ncbi:MAG: phosphopantetheine-binding protein [Roseburia sp.]|nr:phosphopantetheine-binding protein [Muribaculum sp.]MCM1440122.1 phosphopantetheine-binding protein [Roseburia sp.]
MEISEFIEKFAEILDDTDASVLTPDTKFRELDEWSSLTVLGLLALADEEFEVELKADDLKKANTIAELLTVIEEKQ